MTIYAILGITAGALAIIAYVPYIISILDCRTIPNKATWFIWTIIGGLLASSYLVAGDKNTIWLPFSYFFGPLVIFMLSLWYGIATWSRLDKICLILAGLSIIPWLISNDVIFTLIINVFIDAVGAIPTIIKTYQKPDTEEFSSWFIFFVAAILEMTAITDWNMAAIYPVYLFLLAGIIVILTKRKTRQAPL